MLALPDAGALHAPSAGVQVYGARTARLDWTWKLAAPCYLLYVVVGWWLLNVRDFAANDSLARTLTAKIMILGRDPHLANMGFYWMPLPTLARVPFILLLFPFGQTVMAGPATSALFAALTLPVLHATGKAVSAPRWVTSIVVVGYGLSPLTVFSAASAMSETAFGFFLALTMLGWVRWARNGTSRDLSFLAWCMAGATVSRFETLVYIPLVALAVALTSPPHRRLPAAVLAALPAIIAFALYSLASQLIMRDALWWMHAAEGPTATPEIAPWLPDDRTAIPLAMYTITVVLALAPAVVPLIIGAVADIRDLWRSLSALAFVFALPAAVLVQSIQGTSWDVPRFYFMTPLLAASLCLWFVREPRATVHRPPRARRTVAVLTAFAVPLGGVTALFYLADPDHSRDGGEYILMQPLLGRIDPDDPTDGTGQTERAFQASTLHRYREIARDIDPLLAGGALIATDSKYAFMYLFSDHPKAWLFQEQRDYLRILADPAGRFDYLLEADGAPTTSVSVMLRSVVTGSYAEGHWEVFRNYPGEGTFAYDGGLTVWRWIANEDDATAGGGATDADAPGVGNVPLPGS